METQEKFVATYQSEHYGTSKRNEIEIFAFTWAEALSIAQRYEKQNTDGWGQFTGINLNLKK